MGSRNNSIIIWLVTSLMLGLVLAVQVPKAAQFSSTVFAQEETVQGEQQTSAQIDQAFKTDATSTYTVATNGSTRVEHRFTITNLKPTTYLKQYLIKLQFSSVSEITATDQGQNSTPEVVKDGPVTSITLNFNDEVVGEGKMRVFTIAYTTTDISVGSGNVLEVRIPALTGAQESQHLVYVNTPLRFGEPVRTSPQPNKIGSTGELLQLQYNHFPSGGISALFGTEQTYFLTTNYRLKNASSSLGYTQIALPPDTSYQRMEYRLLKPKPESMKIDEDGNWIATYILPANTETNVRVEAQVTVTLEPNPLVPVVQPSAEHLREKPFWQSNSAAVASFAQPALLRDIYDSVIRTLEYDTERVKQGDITTRLGAEGALAAPTAAVCQEYADLLIAAWRSAGIPARRLNGYAFSQNQEIRPLSFQGTVLHAWVDYFDQASGLWRMVDPTWEDTTGGVDYFSEFDLNHIVLSINGFSSSDPAPAGSYADDPGETQLDVTVVTASASAVPVFTATLTPKTAFGVKIPGSYIARIDNQTGRAWYDTHITWMAEPGITAAPSQVTSTFLPFEQKKFPITLITPLKTGWKTTSLTITLVAAGETEPYVITQENYTGTPALISALATVNPSTPLGVIALLSLLSAGSLLVFGRRRKAPLRRQGKKPQKTSEQLPPTETPIGTDLTDGPTRDNRPLA